MMAGSRIRSSFLIGIDFGTTYSGVAWTKSPPDGRGSLDPRNIHVVTSWTDHREYSKVPTQILYPPVGEPKCGHDVPEGSDPLKWFKLLLVKEEELPEDMRDSGHIQRIKDARRRLEEEGKSVEQVIADYLRFLWKHVTTAIEKSEMQAVVRVTPYVVVLTFPAIWSPDAVDKMKNAARQAGILDPRGRAGRTVLHTVEEPEAAALATYADLSEDHPAFTSGEAFVVLDAGGGTCDLITYEVIGTRPLQLKECVRGDGGFCGAVFLDEEFEKKLESLVGRSNVRAMSKTEYRKLLEQGWERSLKKNFNGDDRDWLITVPPTWKNKKRWSLLRPFKKQAKRPAIHGSEMSISTNDMKEVFHPILDQIFELVDEQVSKARRNQGRNPTAILLAGGLGGNKYLFKFLKQKFPGIEVLQRPYPQPWSAICRGAVHRAKIAAAPEPDPDDPDDAGFNEGVISRKSRLNYGLIRFEEFVEGHHHIDDRYRIESHSRDMAINQMSWYIRRDDDMKDREPSELPWKRYLADDRPKSSITIELWKCDGSPPTRKTPQVTLLCKINAQLPPFSELPIHHNAEGKCFRVVDFSLLMTTQGNSLEWSVWISGQKRGEMSVNIVYH